VPRKIRFDGIWLSRFLFLTAVAGASTADHGDAKSFAVSGSLAVELQADATTQSDDSGEELTDVRQKTEAGLTLSLPHGFSLGGLAVFESVRDARPNEDRYFDDNGLYIQELFLEWQGGRFGVKAGKFGQNFGTAWDSASGIWGTDFAEDYEIAEQIGFGGSMSGDAGFFGKAAISASTFFSDRTILAESAFAGRGAVSLADGGPGNTDGFQSFAVALDTEAKDFSIHAAWLHRGSGEAGKVAENGAVLGVRGKAALGNIEIAPLLEIAHLTDREGTPGDTGLYVTVATEFSWRDFSLALSHTDRRLNSVDDALYQVSAGYGLPFGFSVQAGYRAQRVSGIDSETFGALIGWATEF